MNTQHQKQTNHLNLVRDALVGMYGANCRLDCIPLNQHGEAGLLTSSLRIVDPDSANARTRILGHASRLTLDEFFTVLELIRNGATWDLLDVQLRWNDYNFVMRKVAPAE